MTNDGYFNRTYYKYNLGGGTLHLPWALYSHSSCGALKPHTTTLLCDIRSCQTNDCLSVAYPRFQAAGETFQWPRSRAIKIQKSSDLRHYFSRGAQIRVPKIK